MKFKKMHGLGNDFVVFDQRAQKSPLTVQQIKQISDRRFGVGCDQLIVMEPSDKADTFMRIYNPDGSEAGACGNATRCIADIIMKERKLSSCTVETLRGVLPCEMRGDLVRVNMGVPVDVKSCEALVSAYGGATIVDVGNPHVVFFVDNALKIPLERIGVEIEHHSMFPNRTNVEFAHVNKDKSLRLRVWERGTGITQACGSGACATMIAAVENGLVDGTTNIQMDGGILTLEYKAGEAVYMTGPVAYVFDGNICLEKECL